MLRRMSQESFSSHAGWRGGNELSPRRLAEILRARRSVHADDGRSAEPGPPRKRDHGYPAYGGGPDGTSVRPCWAQRPVSLRQRAQAQEVSRRRRVRRRRGPVAIAPAIELVAGAPKLVYQPGAKPVHDRQWFPWPRPNTACGLRDMRARP